MIPKIPQSKVVFLGPISSGKSSLICRITDKVFFADMTATASCDFAFERFDQGASSSDRYLHIWDVSGAQIANNFLRTCFKEARCFVFTIDCSSEATIAAGLAYYQDLSDNARNLGPEFSRPDVRRILVLTKTDLNPAFDKADILEQFLGMGLRLTSDSIDDVFATSAKKSVGTDEFLAYLGVHCFDHVASASASGIVASASAAGPVAAMTAAGGSENDDAASDTSCWANLFCCPPTDADGAIVPLAPATAGVPSYDG